ncbi:MAG: SulP family inorganic anion transporter, partial [Acidimicrobiales bacterium]
MSRVRVNFAPALRPAGPYGREGLRDDVTAGIILTALLVPAGMAYAEVSGLPVVSGLHATIAGLVVYALVGPSRILVLGPDSSLAPIIGAAIIPLAAGDSAQALALAGWSEPPRLWLVTRGAQVTDASENTTATTT